MKKNTLYLLGFLALFRGSFAQGADIDEFSVFLGLPDEVFLKRADEMTFKELRDFALINRAAREKVKAYFASLKNKIIKANCPLLTKKDLLSQLSTAEEFPRGTSDAVPPFRAWDGIKSVPLYVDSKGIKWGYHEREVNLREAMANMPDEVTGVERVSTGSKKKDVNESAETGSSLGALRQLHAALRRDDGKILRL